MDIIEITRKLVSFNTISVKQTIDIANFISEYLEGNNFRVEQHHYDQKGVQHVNVVAIKGPNNRIPLLGLSGHMDTVPFDSMKWKTDPLKLTKIGDKYLGRGICDMKGFLAIAMKAGSEIENRNLKNSFALIFTSNEEVGCVGAKRLMYDKGKFVDSVIIGEPTELQPFILHKGYMHIKIELKGEKGHSSLPYEGKNVIEKALPHILNRILEFRKNLEMIKDSRFSPNHPTLNIGVVSTGNNSAKNIIADYCLIELDIRPIPGQNVKELFYAFSRFITNGENALNGIKIKTSYGKAPTPPMETSKDSSIVKIIENKTGETASSTSFNTEGGVFNSVGINSVVYGPGSIQQAHKPDEFMHEKYLSAKVIENYKHLIRTMCEK
ncbi:MAG: acetylornithine deacetylase [Patescibacteria group bacterium]|jgi:acetylornithine deacetylase|nr:acetylornithine deacetylase [Patescibacteria group bacterium]